MLKCQICNAEPQTSLLTRCCKLFICDTCRQKYEKAGVCLCGKNVNKKLCNPSPEIFDIIKSYYEGRPQQCDRCDKISEVECVQCNMVYCSQCNIDMHNAKGFAKHTRDPIQKQGRSHKKIIDKARRKQQLCTQHKLLYELVCQCGQFLCSSCTKNHKEICNKFSKPKTMSEYKQQYFSQILFKMKKITEYKQKLQTDKKDYLQHFKKQKETYQSYSKLVNQQLEGLRKILDMKITEVKSRLSDYWRQCLDFHHKNQYMIDHHIKKYDDFARLSEKFVEKIVGLEYLEKRVKRIYINQQFFNFRLQGAEQVQFSILNMSSTFKNWQQAQPENILLNFDPNEDKNPKQKRNQSNLPHPSANSELLLQCSQQPLKSRPLTLKSSHNQIHFQFLHLPYQNNAYQIEYGVGLKMKGQQIFKKIENRNGMGIINSLNPSTKYRIRMKVSGGQWGAILEIKTQQAPKILTQVFSISKHTQQAPLQILKTGTVYGSNEINFGIHMWQIKIFPPKNNDEETACVSIGVSNKQQKKPVFVGTTLNYGYQKAMLAVKVTLNCDQNRMTISNSGGGQDQVYQNLPNFPIYPAIQNKGSNPVQIQCIFS